MGFISAFLSPHLSNMEYYFTEGLQNIAKSQFQKNS
jgi:hypothetical protein